MKKFLAMTMALAMVLSLAACGKKDEPAPSGSASSSASASGSDTQAAVTTVEAGKLPYEMVTDDGKFEGIDVEAANAIAQKLGLELVVDDMGFDAALLAAQNGSSDIVMAGVTVTEKRQEVMDFSDSYATGVQVVIVKEDSPIQSIDDLANAEMIGCQKATTGYIYASDTPENGGYGEDHVTAYETGALAVEALKNDQIDAVIIDNEPAKAFVEANPGLKLLDGDWVTEDYAIGMKKGNAQLLDAVNAALAELKADGTLQSIVDKYINAD